VGHEVAAPAPNAAAARSSRGISQEPWELVRKQDMAELATGCDLSGARVAGSWSGHHILWLSYI